jgi:hypothetical protein
MILEYLSREAVPQSLRVVAECGSSIQSGLDDGAI